MELQKKLYASKTNPTTPPHKKKIMLAILQKLQKVYKSQKNLLTYFKIFQHAELLV